MMNKQKSSKAWRWKVAAFLPLLALLLMAFGKTGESVNSEKKLSPQIISADFHDLVKELSKADERHKDTIQVKENVYLVVEAMPEFPGGDKALEAYIAKSMQYPEAAKAKKIQGKVFVTFIINSQGKVTNPTIARSIDPDLDAEALRIVRQMPTWTPGKEKGLPVSVSFTKPVNFVLLPESSQKTK